MRKLDNQGRIVLPKEWRKKFGGEVVVLTLENKIEIFPRKGNLLKFIDLIEVEELKEWSEMKKERLS
ncbi:MAG: AbrB/MazE/SpoVT family DNA-binding domain-containing protein [Candidatus Freyarchaeum deiterrae]